MVKPEGEVSVQSLVIEVWIVVKHERLVSVWGLVICDWIAVKLEIQGDEKFLKDSDVFRMASHVWFGCDQSTAFDVITVW